METKKSNKKSPNKSLDDFAYDAWNALDAYRRAMRLEFLNLDPFDPDYDSFRTLFFELNDLYTGIMNYLDENPNPFENVLI